jgi:hypothetical protein
LEDQGLGQLHIESCIKAALEEKRAHFLRREEREGEEAQIPREILSLEKESSKQDWVGMHPKEGIGKHPRGISAFNSLSVQQLKEESVQHYCCSYS